MGPFQGLGRGPSNVLKFHEILLAHILKTLDRGLPKFDGNPKNLHDITKNKLSN